MKRKTVAKLFVPLSGVQDTENDMWIQNPHVTLLRDVDEVDETTGDPLRSKAISSVGPWEERDWYDPIDGGLFITGAAKKKMEQYEAMYAKGKTETPSFERLQTEIENKILVWWALIGGVSSPVILIHWRGERCQPLGEYRQRRVA